LHAGKAEQLSRDTPVAPNDQNAEIQSLAEATKDLPRLRNEVRQLRQQKPELERLKGENAQLAAQVASGANRPKLAQMEGYVAKEKWTQAGFATPEATVQSFFWAVANKDVGALAECMAGDARKSMEQEIQRSIAKGKQFEEQFEPFTKMQGFRIAEQKQLSDDKIELSVQAAAGGHAMPMRLQLIDGQWKLSN
jgi:hypothetical protein